MVGTLGLRRKEKQLQSSCGISGKSFEGVKREGDMGMGGSDGFRS